MVDYSQYLDTEEKENKTVPSTTSIDYSKYLDTEEKKGEAEAKPEGEAEVKPKEEDVGLVTLLTESPMEKSIREGVEIYEAPKSEYEKLQDKYGIIPDPGGIVGKYVGDWLGAIPEIGRMIGETFAPEQTKKVVNAIKSVDTALEGSDSAGATAYRVMRDTLQGARLGEGEKMAATVASALTGAGLAKKGVKKVFKDNLKGKGKKAASVLGVGTGAVAGEIISLDENDLFLGDVASTFYENIDPKDAPIISEALKLASELKANPNDTSLQKRAKQFQEGLLVAGLGFGVIKSVGLIFKGAAKSPSFIKSQTKKLIKKGEAVDDGVTKPVSDGKTTRQNSAEVIQEVDSLGEPVYKQRGKFTEVLGKLNTAAGRLFQSDAALPKELARASLERSRAEKGFTLRVKNTVDQLKKLQKKDNVSDKSLAKYINENVDDGLSEGVKKKADEIKRIITRNESKINAMLGLSGKNKIGLGFNKGDVYFTRTFESNNNPAYLKKIKKAIEGSLNKEIPDDADFIKKVEGARLFFKNSNEYKKIRELERKEELGTLTKVEKNLLSDMNDEIDGAIEHLVKRLAGDDKSLLLSIWNKGVTSLDSGLATQAAKVLRKRKNLEEPILDLLGEQKDPYAKISATLTNQNKLLSEIKFLSQIDNFFRKNVGKEVELGGLLPGATARTAVKEGKPGYKTSDDLYNITKEALGEFGGTQTKLLKDLYVSPQMVNYIRNGLDIFDPREKMGNALGRTFAHLAAFGQSTQTILDFPAYFINSYGALQSLASNGLLFSPSAWKQAKQATQKFAKQFVGRKDDLETIKAIERLEKLKTKGVIDTDLTSEMISNNVNIYGKSIGSNYGKVGKAYSKFMDKASTAYGSPDTYAKLLAFEGEFAALKKVFPRLKGERLDVYEDRIFDMAADRVRDTIPSYSVAAPAVRTLSRFPIGTYALFPAEMVRTTKNTLKYALKDVKDGIKNGNKRQVAMGMRRLTGLGITATGVDFIVNDNNEQLGINNTTNRVMDILSPEWGKNSVRYHTQGLVEREDGKIMTHFINSGSVDAQDYLKVPVRAIIGKLLSGKEVSEFEVDEIGESMLRSLIGPYTNPKFLTEAVINLAQRDFYSDVPGEEGLWSKENALRVLEEIGSALEPGTLQVVRKYLQSLTSEKVQGIGEGINAYGFPQSSRDIKTWMMTGVRPVKMDVKKSMGFNMAEDIKGVKSTQDAFIQKLSKLDDQPLTPKLRTKIIEEYRNLQEAKFGAMQKLADKVNLFSQLEYQDKNNNTKEFGLEKVLEAATSDFNYKIPDEIIYARTIRDGLGRPKGGLFMPDEISNDQRLLTLIKNKTFSNTLLEDLFKVQSEFYGRRLKE